jgi:hypothetical protein
MSSPAPTFKIGTRVRVKSSVIIYTHPEHKNVAFDALGLEGDVIGFMTEWDGRPVSANLPYLVRFTPKFKAHFTEYELDAIA